MNFKIIPLQNPQTQICLHRDCSESGEEIVRITTYVTNSTGTELMLERTAKFSDAQTAQCFVEDYSEASASKFVSRCVEEDKIWIS
ncbi:hypothetical protein [Dyadobacter luticola]|uniref:Uncharacterized protein n=1 Tax=Dyadobacter luticola TaxID=1979387 RepID=A0A5R9KV39_9BACT|nr:hypothetical protein [Dyadobacter luticola]TLV00146.1 hypothetical protein FEN17_11600 [Dyadobacter luticola]